MIRLTSVAKVGLGHKAVVQQPITRRSAFGGIADLKNAENHDSEGPVSAEAV